LEDQIVIQIQGTSVPNFSQNQQLIFGPCRLPRIFWPKFGPKMVPRAQKWKFSKNEKKPRYLLKEQVYQISALTNIFGLCRLPQRFQTDRHTHIVRF